MKLTELAGRLELKKLTPEIGGDPDIRAGYVSDLLSDVLANAPNGGVLVTVQVHLNVVAVAVHAELAAIIFAAGRTPEEDVRRKAVAEGIALYGSPLTAWEVVGRMYEAGIRGER